jgi:hypothetical protein
MKKFYLPIILSSLIIVLVSCNLFTPKPTETPIPTETSLPTTTYTPEPTITPTSTNTPEPTILPTETPSAPGLPTPSGKPSSEWEGIPIMPSAIAGEGDGSGYSFTVNATPEEIQYFYEQELGKLGWSLLASGQGATEAILLIFMKDTATCSVSIFPLPDGTMYVMLVK